MELVKNQLIKNKTMTQELLKMFKMGRTRLTNQLPNIKEADLVKKLHPNSNSIGFLLRHINEVEHLFAKNVFGLDIRVMASTIGKGIHDTGKFTNLQAELDGLNESASVLEQAILKQADADWQGNVTTAEFGTVTKAEALSRIISHTAYHAGQIGLILKYAN
ncbi:MAG: DinB family protein [Bacteroidetes bacterium]|nr:DinB family protein [Bacteroidota bacterium]